MIQTIGLHHPPLYHLSPAHYLLSRDSYRLLTGLLDHSVETPDIMKDFDKDEEAYFPCHKFLL